MIVGESTDERANLRQMRKATGCVCVRLDAFVLEGWRREGWLRSQRFACTLCFYVCACARVSRRSCIVQKLSNWI